MGYRRTAWEIEVLRTTLSDVEFVGGESLSVDFLTRPETVRDILPVELDPGAEPLLTVQVSRWRSNCVGDFAASAVYVSARHDGVPGAYVLRCSWIPTCPCCSGASCTANRRRSARRPSGATTAT
ncbi:acetoacetate decarboxylase family protein [Blastococcus saxobsidens]|uniref:Acetoacetate decarboxylase family protein n=1 Tax=Blastococcus saxobsidens TaxID=138336 RepID=A0A6L9W0I7_9ACTN|nr:acetoacetate decarboxylase family protein [Blastococcus saxobsidens]